MLGEAPICKEKSAPYILHHGNGSDGHGRLATRNTHLLLLPFREPCRAFPEVDLLLTVLTLCMPYLFQLCTRGNGTFPDTCILL